MWNERGFTLVEMVIAIVVIGVGLAGVLVAFTTTTRASGDALVQRQLLAIAEGLMEEVQSRPFVAVAGGGSSGCERSAFNDLDDYNGYATSGRICTIDGAEVPALAGYSVSVSVQAASLGGVAQARRIVVTASSRSDSLSLVGWRTGYAAP
jgi:MSHA pilin protein MshD